MKIKKNFNLIILLFFSYIIFSCGNYVTNGKIAKIDSKFIGKIEGNFSASPVVVNNKAFFGIKSIKEKNITSKLVYLDMDKNFFNIFDNLKFDLVNIKPSKSGKFLATLGGKNQGTLLLIDISKPKFSTIYETSNSLWFPIQNNRMPWNENEDGLIFLELREKSVPILYYYDIKKKEKIKVLEDENAKFSFWFSNTEIAYMKIVKRGFERIYSLRSISTKTWKEKTLYEYPKNFDKVFELPEIKKIILSETLGKNYIINIGGNWEITPIRLDYSFPDIFSFTSPNGKYLINIDIAKKVIVSYNFETNMERVIFAGPSFASIGNFAFAPQGDYLAFTAQKTSQKLESVIFLADLKYDYTPQELCLVPSSSAIATYPPDGSRLFFTPKGNLIYTIIKEDKGIPSTKFYLLKDVLNQIKEEEIKKEKDKKEDKK